MRSIVRQCFNKRTVAQLSTQIRCNSTAVYPKEHLESFKTFNAMNAKFRVAIVNKCNMNCFFCHNEGMENPRKPSDKTPILKSGTDTMNIDQMVQLMNDFCDLGGGQLNITGGEPLVRKDIVQVLSSINKQKTRVVLNSNIMLADRLLKEPRVDTVDAIYASLHTTRESVFKEHLGIGGAQRVMDNMISLKNHGYRVQINFSLGEYNREGFEEVIDFAIANEIDFKSITLIRSDEIKSQYGEGKEWSDPVWIVNRLEERGMKKIGTRTGFGGFTTVYKSSPDSDHKIEIKNVGKGRLVTDFCKSCHHHDKCGEGIYALRSGVDGVWKPCLLNKQGFESIDTSDVNYKRQILSVIHKMVGDWNNHKFIGGAPQ
jgi:cyclic pyranopterin phosphate synthase